MDTTKSPEAARRGGRVSAHQRSNHSANRSEDFGARIARAHFRARSATTPGIGKGICR